MNCPECHRPMARRGLVWVCETPFCVARGAEVTPPRREPDEEETP